MRVMDNIGDYDECPLCRRWERIIEASDTKDEKGANVRKWEGMYARHLKEVPHRKA